MTQAEPTILLVDDDVDICDNLSDILNDLGYQVDVAHNGMQALELARRKTYDVALLDLKMPGMDGLTLYRELKVLHAGTVAMIVSAFASEEIAQEALSAGAWKVVHKPVHFGDLLSLIDEALGQPLVLIVDDDRDLCANLWDIFRQRGYRVCLAHDGAEATRKLNDDSYIVVLIDMKIPDGDGSRVFRQVRAVNPQARTLLITGCRPEMDALITQVLAEGADGVCYKPFDVPKLLELLNQLAGVSQLGPGPR